MFLIPFTVSQTLVRIHTYQITYLHFPYLRLPKDDGLYIPILHEKCKIVPAEFKHGKSKSGHQEYDLQLTAQAMCLEEMFECTIEKGEIYYIGSKTRTEVPITDTAKQKVKNILIQINQIIDGHVIPQAKYMRRCPKCSMYSICNPKTDMIQRYMRGLWEQYREKN